MVVWLANYSWKKKRILPRRHEGRKEERKGPKKARSVPLMPLSITETFLTVDQELITVLLSESTDSGAIAFRISFASFATSR
jgi:hypothetical protein